MVHPSSIKYRFFFAAGSGDIIRAHNKAVSSDQMSVTFSSEFENFCEENGAEALMVSSGKPADKLISGNLTLESKPKRLATGLLYHIEEIRYGLVLAIAARRFKATHAFIQSGSTHYFVMIVFCLFGMKVVPIMHNALWPAGYPELVPVV